MSIGRLVRHLDIGLINRVLAGLKPPPEPLRRQKPPRKAATYRAARRNAARLRGVRG